MLRHGDRTVNELAEALHLADNSIRAHLTALVHEGLIQLSGERRGLRRPHKTYRLAAAAEHLFLTACDPLLASLLTVVSARVSPEICAEIFVETGHRMATGYAAEVAGEDARQRMEKTLAALQNWGGVVQLEEAGGKRSIRGYRCPLSALVADHPQICLLAEAFVSRILNVPVKQRCHHDDPPRCYFEVPA